MPRFCVHQEASDPRLYAVIDRFLSTSVRRYYVARFVPFTRAQAIVYEEEARIHPWQGALRALP